MATESLFDSFRGNDPGRASFMGCLEMKCPDLQASSSTKSLEIDPGHELFTRQDRQAVIAEFALRGRLEDLE